MRTSTGLRSKIWVAFILQVAAISLATVLGVYGASAVLKDVLIQRALVDEAAHYFERLDREPGADVPDTFNMTGYLVPMGADRGSVPAELRELHPGYHSLPRMAGGALVHVEDHPAHGRLYLVFNQEQVDALAFFFGAVPLVLVLAVIYVIAFFTYRVSRRAVSPVIWLANIVQNWDPKKPDVSALDPEQLPVDVEGEVQVLAHALHDFATRIESFVERERNFTRDASHELRSPLTVIRIACDMLLADDALDPYLVRSIQRIKGSARDMEALIEAFLILAREGDTGLPEEDFVINEVVREEVDKLCPLLEGKPVRIELDDRHAFALHAPQRAVAVIISNLLRNACVYTDEGSITVTIGPDHVEIRDTGVGMTPEQLARVFEPFYRGDEGRKGGQGIGLTIVRRLSTRFGWPVTLDSVAGQGTVATIRFPHPQPVDA